MIFFYLKNDVGLFLCEYNRLIGKFYKVIMAEDKNSFTSYSKKLSDEYKASFKKLYPKGVANGKWSGDQVG